MTRADIPYTLYEEAKPGETRLLEHGAGLVRISIEAENAVTAHQTIDRILKNVLKLRLPPLPHPIKQ